MANFIMKNITLFEAAASCRIDLYEKPTGMLLWFLGLVALREWLTWVYLRGAGEHRGRAASGALPL